MKTRLPAVLVAMLALAPLPGRALAATATATSAPVLPWIANDYEKAATLAKSRKVPLFVEAWAPWCHTCRSMRAYVFTDPTLARHAKDFVWLEVDTEDPRNSAFRKHYPLEAIPCFYVIDPTDRAAKMRWVGSLTITQLHALLDDAHSGAYSPRALLDRVAHADSLFGAGNNEAAIPAYRAVLGSVEPGWAGYGRATESLLYSLLRMERYADGLALAREALPKLGRSSSGLNVSASGLTSAYSLADSVPGRLASISEFEASTRALVTDFSYPAAGDDRSGAWIELMSARQALNDSLGGVAVAREWAAFLESAATAATTPDQRMVYDSHRLSAYIEIGEPQRAIPMLQQSERDRPDDYNPPARLAVAYLAMKKYDEALAASDRAMTRAYGPRKLLLYSTRADIYQGKGEISSARRTLEGALAYLETLPEEQRSPSRKAGLERKLAALPTP